MIWNGLIDKEPALVIRPKNSGEVSSVVNLAREQRLLLSIKGGGHNISGLALADGGLTLDMSLMREVRVDPEQRLVHVGAGCLLGDVDRATQDHGLATTLGFVSETGVAGLTLGGGFGYLSRRFGLYRRRAGRSGNRHRRWPGADGEPRNRILICSGRSAAAAGISGWSPGSPTACMKSGPG